MTIMECFFVKYSQGILGVNDVNSSQHQQKQNMSSTMDCKQENDTMKEHNKRRYIALSCETFEKKDLIKCLYNAKGHSSRDNCRWYKHSNDENSIKRNKKNKKILNQYDNQFQNCTQLQNENCQNANEEKNDNFNDCDLTFGKGESTLNRDNKFVISIDTIVDNSKLHSKSINDYGYKGLEVYQDCKIIDKTHNIEINQYAKNDEEICWQEDIEERANSRNGCTFSYGEDSKILQKNNENILFEGNVNHCKCLSNNDNYKYMKDSLKYHELAIKSFESKEEEYQIKEGKSQLTNTTTSSENLLTLSSTASLDHIQGTSSLISSSIQFQVPQLSNLTTSIVDDKIEVSSINSLEDVCGNTLNSKSPNDFISKQTTQEIASLHVPSNHPHTIYSNSLLKKTTNITSSRSNNTSPPIQYQQFCNPIPQKHGIRQNDIVQSSPFSNVISSISPTNQNLLSSLTNLQQSSQNMKFVSSSKVQNDYNVSLKHPPQPSAFDYQYHQTSTLANSFQQKYCFNNSLSPQFIHSSHLQSTSQPKFKESSLINMMQYNNKSVIPLPPPSMEWPSPLPSTTMMYSMKPIQQNYIVPPPPPPPLPPALPSFENINPKEYNNTIQSYPSSQKYGSFQKQYIDQKPVTNFSYEILNTCSKAESTLLPLQGLDTTKNDLSQLHNYEIPTFENVSPPVEGGQSWIEVGGDEIIEGIATTKAEQKQINKEYHPKTLFRTKVAEYVKEILKPKWREGMMTKEAFKTITKKAVDKVIGTIKPPHVPNTTKKVASYMMAARPKILKLVQEYVDKYVKD